MIRFLRNICIVLLIFWLSPKTEPLPPAPQENTTKNTKVHIPLNSEYIYVEDEDGLWAATEEQVTVESGKMWHHFSLRKIQ